MLRQKMSNVPFQCRMYYLHWQQQPKIIHKISSSDIVAKTIYHAICRKGCADSPTRSTQESTHNFNNKEYQCNSDKETVIWCNYNRSDIVLWSRERNWCIDVEISSLTDVDASSRQQILICTYYYRITVLCNDKFN